VFQSNIVSIIARFSAAPLYIWPTGTVHQVWISLAITVTEVHKLNLKLRLSQGCLVRTIDLINKFNVYLRRNVIFAVFWMEDKVLICVCVTIRCLWFNALKTRRLP